MSFSDVTTFFSNQGESAVMNALKWSERYGDACNDTFDSPWDQAKYLTFSFVHLGLALLSGARLVCDIILFLPSLCTGSEDYSNIGWGIATEGLSILVNLCNILMVLGTWGTRSAVTMIHGYEDYKDNEYTSAQYSAHQHPFGGVK